MSKFPVRAEGKTFRVRAETRYKNATLVSAREQLGLSAREVAEQVGLSYAYYLNTENMRQYPSLESQRKICSFYCKNGISLFEENVFPVELSDVAREIPRKVVHEREIKRRQISITSLPERDYPSLENAGEIRDPEKEVERGELSDRIQEALNELGPLQERIIRLRYFDEVTLREAADILGISRDKVQRIELRAMEKLQTLL
jgi:RNA polymerase sigma factor (sigma-70 family)